MTLDSRALSWDNCAPGAACAAFTLGAGAAEAMGDLVFRVRLPLDMERRVGEAGVSTRGRERGLDGGSDPLVKSPQVVMSTGDE